MDMTKMFKNPLFNLINKFITPYQLSILGMLGSLINFSASGSASNALQQGWQLSRGEQERSLRTQREEYEKGLGHVSPYLETGRRGLESYEDMIRANEMEQWGGFGLEDMQEDPGYQFRLQQGYQGLDRMAARGGERFSGKRAAGLMDYGQRMGAQEFQASRSRAFQDYQARRGEDLFQLEQYRGLAGMGQQAAGFAANLGAGYAGAVTGIRGDIGQTYVSEQEARAAGMLGKAKAATSGMSAMGMMGGGGG